MVSGRYFFPKAPLLCLNRIPACAVTYVNSLGPEGRERFIAELGSGVGARGADDRGAGAAAAAGVAADSLECFCLQPDNPMIGPSSEQQTTRHRGSRKGKPLSPTITAPPFAWQGGGGANPAKSREAWRMVPR